MNRERIRYRERIKKKRVRQRKSSEFGVEGGRIIELRVERVYFDRTGGEKRKASGGHLDAPLYTYYSQSVN